MKGKSPSNYIDLTGKRFAKLTVIKRNGSTKQGQAKWLCKCDCGNEVTTRSQHLLEKKTKSCSCLRHSHEVGRFKDRRGEKYGKLTIKGYTKHNGKFKCVCECECSATVLARTGDLRSGNTKSCGCLRVGENSYKYNPNMPLKTREKRRNFPKYNAWIQEQLLNQKYTCRSCGKKGGTLNVHHVRSWANYPELRFDPSNAFVMCEQCHHEFHFTYGKGNNDEYQLEEFLKEYATI